MKKINGYYFGIKKDKSKNLYEVAVTNPEAFSPIGLKVKAPQ